MINYNQFREFVVVPTLKYLDPVISYSEEAVDLLMMTAAHESKGGTYLKQIKGPALGVYQMEPATHYDIYKNYLRFNPKIKSLLEDFTINAGIILQEGEDMVFNLAYATAMARVHYYRVPKALPKRDVITEWVTPEMREDDYLRELAEYAKKHYNTYLGKAEPEDYYKDFITWRDI